MDEEAIQRRRDLMRQRALTKAQIGLGTEEVLEREEEKSEEEDDEDETSEEESSEEEEEGARLKPVFVRKKVGGCFPGLAKIFYIRKNVRHRFPMPGLAKIKTTNSNIICLVRF